MEYLTQVDFEEAARNNVPYENLYLRFYRDHWNKERAKTEPVRSRKVNSERPSKIAERNGISKQTFHKRIKLGWSEMRAATEPPRRRRTNENSTTYTR